MSANPNCMRISVGHKSIQYLRNRYLPGFPKVALNLSGRMFFAKKPIAMVNYHVREMTITCCRHVFDTIIEWFF